MKKIVHIITGLHSGGAETVLADIVRGTQKDYDVVVVSLTQGGRVREQLEERGVRVVSVAGGMKYNPLIIVRLALLLKREQPDVVHTHLFHATVCVRIASMFVRVPRVISTFHGSLRRYPLRRFILALTSRFSNINVVVSKKIQNEIRGSVVIQNGVDCHECCCDGSKSHVRENLGLAQKDFIFCTVGRLVPEKKHVELVRMWSSLQSKAVLLIVGGGEERHTIEREVDRLGLKDSVILCGHSENVCNYLCASDAFVLASESEGFSLAVCEAACAALPIATTDVGVASDIVDSEFCVRSLDGLREAVCKIVALSDEDREVLGRANQKRVALFSKEAMVENYRVLYENN